MADLKQKIIVLKKAHPVHSGGKPLIHDRKQRLIAAVQSLRQSQADLSGLDFEPQLAALEDIVVTLQAAIGKRAAGPASGPDTHPPAPGPERRKFCSRK